MPGIVDVIVRSRAKVEAARELNPRRRFDEHLGACPHCTAYLDQMRTVLRLTGRLTEEEIPEPARKDLLRVFREWKSA